MTRIAITVPPNLQGLARLFYFIHPRFGFKEDAANIIKSQLNGIYNDELMTNEDIYHPSLSKLVDAFSWESSPQGHKYWEEINDYLESLLEYSGR